MGADTSGGSPAGFFLSLLTESFAVRALLGSLIAASLATVVVRAGWIRGARARRLAVLAPVLAAATAGFASVVAAETYLPQLWVTSVGGASGPVLELLGELRVISPDRGVDVLVLLWGTIAGVLLTRRLLGVLATRRLLRGAVDVPADSAVHDTVRRLAEAMGVRKVQLRLLPGCAGGALTAGTRRPVIVIDPALLHALDAKEAEGLLAHELAHVARRDTLLASFVGVFSDLTFFLPTVHLAARWLRREREESADEIASSSTRRPGALASGILKVWESASPSAARLQVCGAVPAVASWPGSVLLRGRRRNQPSEAARIVAARVERLVSPLPRPTVVRLGLEIWIAALVILAASAAAVVLPSWIATDLDTYSVAFGYVPPPAQPVESPAFATFRALAPAVSSQVGLSGWEAQRMRPVTAAESPSTCPCIETQAQWHAELPATAPPVPPVMTWRRTSAPSWAVGPAAGSVEARPLLTLTEAGPQVGFFVVARHE